MLYILPIHFIRCIFFLSFSDRHLRQEDVADLVGVVTSTGEENTDNNYSVGNTVEVEGTAHPIPPTTPAPVVSVEESVETDADVGFLTESRKYMHPV